MNQILSINTIKNVFSALGAKTSDSNYAVGLFDKTSAEPKGIMGMSDLASVLGADKVLRFGMVSAEKSEELLNGSVYAEASLKGWYYYPYAYTTINFIGGYEIQFRLHFSTAVLEVRTHTPQGGTTNWRAI